MYTNGVGRGEAPPMYKNGIGRGGAPLLYYQYINPWIRLLIGIILSIYLFTISGSILTYRNIAYQQSLNQIKTNPTLYPGDTNPLAGDQLLGWVILRDLGFDALPAQSGSAYNSWRWFVDFTPIFLTCLVIVFCLFRLDIIRFTEYVGYQIVLFTLNAIVHVVTSYPDAGGSQSSCHDSIYNNPGSYFAYSFTTTNYCGDMMFSEHTTLTLLAIIMIRRLLNDLSVDLLQKTPNKLLESKQSVQRDHFFNIKSAMPWISLNDDMEPLLFLFRCILFIWFTLLVIGILLIRYHYTADILVAIMFTILISSNDHLGRWLVRFLYRPNYTNYNHWYKPVHLKGPLNKEQVIYQLKIKTVAKKGIIF